MSISVQRRRVSARLCHFQGRQSFSKGSSFVSTHLSDEVDERGSASSGLRRLGQRVYHQAGHEFVAAVQRDIPVRAIVTLLNDELLLGEPLKNGHDGRVRKFSMGGKRLVDLPHCLWFRRIPQMIHHCTLEFA